VLARLNSLDGVRSTEVDHRGELLRLRLDSGQVLSAVRATLVELGYRADDVSRERTGAGEVRWYGAATVHELSRDESEVIARRVTPAVARGRGLGRAAGDQLASAVSDALYRCFTAHTLGAGAPPGALRTECSRAVEDAARALIGEDGARELVAALWEDLDTRERPEPEEDRNG